MAQRTDSHGSDDLGELLVSAARTLRRRSMAGLGEHGVTPAQARALRVLTVHGASRPSLIAEHLRIAPRSATEVIDALEERGLVTRAPDPGDRRAVLVELTELGHRVQGEVAAARAEQHRAVFAALPAADRRELGRILRRLIEAGEQAG